MHIIKFFQYLIICIFLILKTLYPTSCVLETKKLSLNLNFSLLYILPLQKPIPVTVTNLLGS